MRSRVQRDAESATQPCTSPNTSREWWSRSEWFRREYCYNESKQEAHEMRRHTLRTVRNFYAFLPRSAIYLILPASYLPFHENLQEGRALCLRGRYTFFTAYQRHQSALSGLAGVGHFKCAFHEPAHLSGSGSPSNWDHKPARQNSITTRR